MGCEQETVPRLSNGTTVNNLERPPFQGTISNGLSAWLSEILNDTKHRAVSLWQLSIMFKIYVLTLVCLCIWTQAAHSSLAQSRHLAVASRCLPDSSLQMSQNGYLDGRWRPTSSDRLDTRKLSASFLTPPTGSWVRLRHSGHVNSR